jgi:hypothetical protein
MPKAGKVLVTISPFDARLISSWLRVTPTPLWGVPQSNALILSNGVRTDLLNKLDAIANRKRQAAALTGVGVELDRQDAEWFAAKVSGGMMFSAGKSMLPIHVRLFCLGCLAALRKRRGRPQLHGHALRATTGRAHLDPRHRKRLKARERIEQATRQLWPDRKGLGAAIFSADE